MKTKLRRFPVMRGTDDSRPAPQWEQQLMAATTVEEVRAALALKEMTAPARLAYSEDQERDERGRFSGGGGSGGGDTSGTSGTTSEAGSTPDNPIKGIESADEALQLIGEGKYVEMRADMVAVSLDRLAAISKEARDRGEKAPLYDLCKITSSDKSLFCGSSVVATRLEMPQLGGVPTPGTPADAMPKDSKGEVDITGAFLDKLAADGVGSTPTEVDASELKASQNELNGAKVAGMMQAMQNGTMSSGSIMVSRDNYVIDGHHRWAAEVGTKYTGGGRLTMPIVRIDMPIQQVLDEANAFAERMGMPQMQASVGARMAYSEDQPRDERGRFGEGSTMVETVRTSGGLTMSALDGSAPTTGYNVRRGDVATTIESDADFFGPQGVDALMSWMDAHADTLAEPNSYVGLWHDTEHGEVALDVVENIADRDAAIAAGRDRDEQAIWDVVNQVEIPTGGTGQRAATIGGRYGPSDLPRQAAEAVGRDDPRGTAGMGRGDPREVRGTGTLRRSDARIIRQLTRARQQLGTRLLAEAQQAYEHAARAAGVKLITRSRSRTSPTRQRQVAAAVDGGAPLLPLLGAVGIKEEELLRNAFDTFNEQVVGEVKRYRERQAQLLGRLDTKLTPADHPPAEIIADYLVAGLTAMVRARLRVGETAMVAATRRPLVKLAPAMPEEYDLPAGLPDPDTLASAAARLVREALFGADGQVTHMQLPATPDRLPTVVTTDLQPTLEERLVLEFNVLPVWEWVHGAFGEPVHALDEHEALDGFTTTDPSDESNPGDPELVNDAPWPEFDWYFPNDHEGCTCLWTVAVGTTDE